MLLTKRNSASQIKSTFGLKKKMSECFCFMLKGSRKQKNFLSSSDLNNDGKEENYHSQQMKILPKYSTLPG